MSRGPKKLPWVNTALTIPSLKLRREGNVLFNDVLNTFLKIRLYDVAPSSSEKLDPPQEGRKGKFYLLTHSTHFIYGYMEGRKGFI